MGPVRLLRHKESGRVRLLMRQDKTLKIRANHLVMPSLELKVRRVGQNNGGVHTLAAADGQGRCELT